MVGIIHLDHLLVGHTAPSPCSWTGAFQGISLPGNPEALDQAFQPWSIQQGTAPGTVQDVQSPPWESWRWEEESTACPIRGNGLEPHPSHPAWVWVLLPGMGWVSGSGGVTPIPKMLRRVRRKGSKAVENFWLPHISSVFFHLFALNQNPWISSKAFVKPLAILHERARSMGMIPF